MSYSIEKGRGKCCLGNNLKRMHLIENPTKYLEGLLNSSVLKRHAVCVPVVDT